MNEKWEDIIREWRAVMYAKTEADHYATAWDKLGAISNTTTDVRGV